MMKKPVNQASYFLNKRLFKMYVRQEETDTAQGLTKKKGELIKRLFKMYVRQEESDTAQGLTKKKGELIKRLFKIYVRRVIREESKKIYIFIFS